MSWLTRLTGRGRTIPAVSESQEQGDLERLDPQAELDPLAKEPDSWLPAFLVDAQAELARVPVMELGERMASLVIATALRRPGSTPSGVMRELIESVSEDEEWRERIGPELRRVLTARGIELGTE